MVEALVVIKLGMITTETKITITITKISDRDKWTIQKAVVETDLKKDSGRAILSQLRKSKPKKSTLRETLISLQMTEAEDSTTKDQENRETVLCHFADVEVELKDMVSELFEHSNRASPTLWKYNFYFK